MTVPLWAWFAVLGVILLMLAVDLVADRKAHVSGVREAAVWSIVWVTLGVLGALIENFSWILYVFAAFLIYTGWRMLHSRNDHVHPERSRILKVFRRFVPMTDAYHGQKFLIRKAGMLVATPLLAVLVLVLVLVEITDIIFAVTSEPFLVFTANAFAILGLRAMYFLLADLIHRFIYLKIGLAFVLIWVGIKMLLLDVLYIPTTMSLAVVVTIITVSIVASLRVTRGQGRREVHTEAVGVFRSATDEELAAVEPVFRRSGRVPVGSAKDRSDE
ncbi:tellurium resistance protein TerC [Cryobacterium sp. Hh7]|uniref:TerC family protein n=1 Tax=Cryobacterium sp. Hh7 TaxID=1259159 RepID=UPI00106AD7C3|nr:tellurium resistance protein TerC [Cryobacterium sp. Hh7]TFD62002.1 tellurium resistance protein TerC [Cryobacterium sp. Hh7]